MFNDSNGDSQEVGGRTKSYVVAQTGGAPARPPLPGVISTQPGVAVEGDNEIVPMTQLGRGGRRIAMAGGGDITDMNVAQFRGDHTTEIDQHGGIQEADSGKRVERDVAHLDMTGGSTNKNTDAVHRVLCNCITILDKKRDTVGGDTCHNSSIGKEVKCNGLELFSYLCGLASNCEPSAVSCDVACCGTECCGCGCCNNPTELKGCEDINCCDSGDWLSFKCCFFGGCDLPGWPSCDGAKTIEQVTAARNDRTLR
jgi:hypothetical protein